MESSKAVPAQGHWTTDVNETHSDGACAMAPRDQTPCNGAKPAPLDDDVGEMECWDSHDVESLATIGINQTKASRFNPAGGEPSRRSYPPVGSVVRAFEILRAVNRLHVATVRELHIATGQNKSTIVRMLETLMAEGYIVADSLCGGYRVTSHVQELTTGYSGVSRVIEAARPLAIELTRRFKWPVGLGVLDNDAIALRFYTGAISPWAHSDVVLKQRPSLVGSAMGRAYLAFCPPPEREKLLDHLRSRKSAELEAEAERRFRKLLAGIRTAGFAVRDPRIEPRRMTTIAIPVRDSGRIVALMSCSFYKTVIGERDIVEKAAKPLAAVVSVVESAISAEQNQASGDMPSTEGMFIDADFA